MPAPPDPRQALFPVAHAQQFGRVVLHCVVVGVVAGAAAIAFDGLVRVTADFFLGTLAGFSPLQAAARASQPGSTFRPWVLALLPIAGGLVGGLLVRGLAPDAEGAGTDAAIDAYHNRQGRVLARIPIVKMLASTITLGTGGSAGREGPIAQIGAGLGALTADVFGLTAKERRLLMVAGMAAGIGAIFRAPLAAALFSAEILYREVDMEFEVIVPSVISSIVAYSVFTIALGTGALFVTPPFTFDNPLELGPYTVLALVMAAGARTYVRVFLFVRARFTQMRVPPTLKPMLGGVVVGSFAFFLPEALGQGYGIVQQAFTGEVGIGLLLALAAGKTITTSFTVGSGQSGGVFGPAIVIGGALAGAVGLMMEGWLPAISPPQGAFVVVGMAGFFAAAANTPISTIIMVSEITGSYRLLIPSMWVCIIAFTLVRRSSLYVRQLERRSDSPVHLGEMMGDVLDRMSVGSALEAEHRDSTITVAASARLPELREAFSATRHACFPVVDEAGKLVGVVDDRALRLAICDDDVRDVLVAADLMEPAPLLVPTESLHSAVSKMVASGRDELVVVDPEDAQRVVGMVSRRDLIAAYDQQIRRDEESRERAVRQAWSFATRGRGKGRTPAPSAGGGGGGAEDDGEEAPANPT